MKVVEILKEELADAKRQYDIFCRARKVVESLAGKRMTKRYEWNFREVIPEAICVSLEETFGGKQYELVFRDMYRLKICKSGEVLDVDKFDNYNISYAEGDKKRIEQLEKEIENPESIIRDAKDYRKAVNTIMVLDDINGARADMRKSPASMAIRRDMLRDVLSSHGIQNSSEDSFFRDSERVKRAL
jgi:hypothetical protein